MTSSRNRRAWSIDKILYRYFQIRDAGGPSATMNPEDAHPPGRDTRREPTVPKWIQQLCDVGRALEQLPAPLRDAVVAKWEAAIALEDAERDVIVLDVKVCKAQRAGGDWRALKRRLGQAEDHSHGRWKVRRRLEQRRAYREGMDALEQILIDGES